MMRMGKYFVGAEIECPWEELPSCKEKEILPEMRHMTLNFIGEKKEKPVCLTHPLVIGSAGYFDGMLFLTHAVAYHAVFLSNALKRDGFLPHVTIARGENHKALEWQKWFQPLPFYFKAIHLYKSLENNQYEKLESCSLNAPFEAREHTDDLAFIVRGKSLDEIFIHSMIALAFSFPQTLQFFEKKGVRSIKEVAQELNRLIARMDTAIGAPFKAVSYSKKVKQGEWEMIIDV